jgi:hypothetical protein
MSPEIDPGCDEPGVAADPALLFNMVYCSRAAAGIDADAVDRIVATSRRNNAHGGITGVLVFGAGVFFQWLEGPRAAIEALLTTLRADPRHERIVVLSQAEESRERLFPQWDMERVDAAHIRDVLDDALGDTRDPRDTAALRKLLAEIDARGASEERPSR